ncbi:MAG: hypothetical protein ACFB6R_11320 [Alphaproteobacteria bacterium]
MDPAETDTAPSDALIQLDHLRSRVEDVIGRLSPSAEGPSGAAAPDGQPEMSDTPSAPADIEHEPAVEAPVKADQPEPSRCGGDPATMSDLGIGPGLAHRLATLGIRSPADLKAHDAATLAGLLGPLVDPGTLQGWIDQAAAHAPLTEY